MADTIEDGRVVKLHEEILYPTVRVVVRDGGGSGTVLYSKEDDGEVVTMVMTNHHVIEGHIEVKKKWVSRLAQERKVEFKETVHVEFFKYNDYSRNIGSFAVEADIVAYDADQDMALLKLRDKERLVDDVATIFPVDKLKEIHIFDHVYAVGAAMGHAPLPTLGEITHMDDEIDHYKYFMTTANIIYGNSGGALYRYSSVRDKWEYVGIPSRITVNISGFSADAITHMGYAIPVDRIVQFMEANCYQFIYDDEYTVEQCDTLRREMKEKADNKLDAKFGIVGDTEE